jgi:hypothetical protein
MAKRMVDGGLGWCFESWEGVGDAIGTAQVFNVRDRK